MRSQKAMTPLPYKKIFVLGLILFSNNCSIWMIFSYLPFMVLYYYPDFTATEVGYRCGILASAFSLGALLGNFIWGIAADRFGRRPTLMLGLLGTGFAAALFGIAPTFWIAVFARFLWGLLNGNIGIAKTYMGEITDDTNAAKSMAIFGAIGGAGRTIGPLIGGFLSQPSDRYAIFDNPFFHQYPFILPPLMVMGFCVIVFIISYFELTETLQRRKRNTRSRTENHYSKLENGSIDESESDLSPEDTNRLMLISSENSTNSSIRKTSNENDNLSSIILNRNWTVSDLVRRKSNNGSVSSLPEYTNVSSTDEDDFDVKGGGLQGLSQGNNNNGRSKRNLSPSSSIDSLNIELLNYSENVTGRSGNGNGREGEDDMLPSPPPSPQEYQPARFTKTSRKVSFNSLVEVKTIDTTNIQYNPLKKVTAEDIPLADITSSATSSFSHHSPPQTSSLPSLCTSPSPSHYLDDDNTSSKDTFAPSHPRYSFANDRLVKYTNGAELIDYEYSMSIFNTVNSLLNMPLVFNSCLLYGLLSFAHIMISEVFPLWLVIPVEEGGFGFDSSKIGLTIMISGPISILTQIFMYPSLESKFGVLKVFRLGVLYFMVLSLLTPSITMFDYHSHVISYILVATSYTLVTVVVGWSYVCVFVFVNNSCYSHQRATVNGIGQTFAAIGRMCGPYIAGTLFAASASGSSHWPFNYCITFYIIGSIALFIYNCSKKLPNKIQRRRREPKNPRYAVTMEKSQSQDSDDGFEGDFVDSPPEELNKYNTVNNGKSSIEMSPRQ